MSDHEEFCQQLATGSCFEYIQQSLALMPQYSPSWYKVKSYELDYYFDTRVFDTLYKQTSQLLQQRVLPDGFKLQLYFYHAKSLISFKRHDEAKHYVNLAVEQLDGAFANFGTPLRLVELANMHYSLGNVQEAFELLTQAEQNFSKHRDPLFWFELYANQALIMHRWGDLAAAEQLRIQALEAGLVIGHKSKLMVAYGNLARTQQLLGNYTSAYQNYLNSLPYLIAGEDDVTHAIHQLRLAEISWQSAQYSQSVMHLKQVKPQLLPDRHMKKYQQLTIKPELMPLLAALNTPDKP
ncbi:hypothetical protein [Rheinheimera maricola]|uniref:Tetratricopeptide repeat protein n=1 Tax=Rheinheimera maricola TaxID=2793282 RepID=A0ABS7X788_9GAMM|nr:hypothetical protein [Rheinheimera maricola]MBZ9611054.1 hypothetical protein [Rheinheimera maricola]